MPWTAPVITRILTQEPQSSAILWGGLAARRSLVGRHISKDKKARLPDQLILDAVKNGPISPFLLRCFALEYGVHRKLISRNDFQFPLFADMSKTLDDAYRETKASSPREQAEVWHFATGKVSTILMEYYGQSQWLKVFTMKIFWFYHPLDLPMWDENLDAALSLQFGRKKYDLYSVEGAEAALGDFDTAYKTELPSIRRIEASIVQMGEAQYPYGPRIYEKALWLLGSQDKIQQFAHLQNDPHAKDIAEAFYTELR